ARAHDAGKFRRHVQHGIVLDVRVPAKRHVVVLVPSKHGERPDARAFLDGHVTDNLRRRVDVCAGMNARLAARHLADHATGASALDEASPARHTAPPARSVSTWFESSPSSRSTASLSSPRRGAPLTIRAGERDSFTGLPSAFTSPTPG